MTKDIIKIFSSNLIKMMVTFITAFLVPMVLSVNSYGYYKVYTFYAAYIGILHLGYCDGIYLDYGGKDENSIEKERISTELATLFSFSLGLALVGCVYGLIRHNFTIICLGLTVVPNIIYTFYSYVYQATGDFKKYTWMLNLSTIMNLVLNGLLVIFRISDYRLYICVCVIVQFVSFLAGTFFFGQSGWIQKSKFSKSVFIRYIQMGSLLMIGNFAYTFFVGIDKWFIKFTLDITAFSMYSFASQMLTVVNMFITPISMTLYSNLSKKRDHLFEREIKQLLVTLLMLMPIAIYIIIIIISTFMEKYSSAINLIALLLITQIFLSLNLAVFVNLYKVYKMQRVYMKTLLSSLILAMILDLAVAIVHPNPTMYAGATLISCLVWLTLNFKQFKYMLPDKKECCYVTGLLILFLIEFILKSNIVRIIIYLFSYLLVTYILMNNEWKKFMSYLSNIKEKF